MCIKEEVPACFGVMHSKKAAECMGSSFRESCILKSQCATAQRCNKTLSDSRRAAITLLVLHIHGVIPAQIQG